MNVEFMKQFDWLGTILNQELTNFYDIDTIEYKVIDHLKEGWEKKDGIGLLKELTAEYGEKAGQTVEQFLKINILRDWAEIGKKEANKGTEVKDFIRMLWEPLKEKGFKYEYKEENNIVTFHLTKCPVYELAEKTDMHEWFYHIACASDFYTTPSFSKEIGFTRTKSLMQGDECCNHTYYYKNKIKTKDSLLGYCGLYCGACPSYQKTNAVEPVNYKKDNFYEPCEGCTSEIMTIWCSDCEIKKSNKKKNIRVCYDCNEFPCEIMNNFMNDNRYPYHKEVEDKMKLLKEVGFDQWLKLQENYYKCKKCDTTFNFFQNKCDKCGNDL